MGVYDTFGEEGVQLKAGMCMMKHYAIGDDVTGGGFADGIYFGLEGVVGIYKQKVVGIWPRDAVRNKWGGAGL